MELAEIEQTEQERDELALIAFQAELTNRLASFFRGDADLHALHACMDTLQPTSAIALLAAQAAAAVLIAFERGYRMGD